MRKWSSILFVAVALSTVLHVCTLAQQKSTTGRLVEFRGKKTFVLPTDQQDTITVVDPVTSESIMQLRKQKPFPTLVSGKKIYNNSEITEPVACNEGVIENSFEEHILKALKSKLLLLPDGLYSMSISNLVVDRRGRIIYHQFYGMDVFNRMQSPARYRFNLMDSGYYYDQRLLVADTASLIADAVEAVFADARLFTPARIGNRKVMALYNTFFDQFLIVIKDRKMSLDKRNVMVSKVTAYSH
jgi:hypothetical protein